jgi:hypothetical protein
MRFQIIVAVWLSALLGISPIAWSSAIAQEPSGESNASGEKVLLRYKMQEGTILGSQVTHLAKTDTKIDKSEQSSQSRTVSQKVWEVTSVDPQGHMTFIYRIDQVDMSQQVGDAPEIHYTSTQSEPPPRIYEKVAETIGKPIATVTIDARGQVVDRDKKSAAPSLGMGDIAVVFPEQSIGEGETWDVPREIKIRTEDGGTKTIKIRERYTLEKVRSGIATIAIESQPLTPVQLPQEESQIVQQLSRGTLKFDIDAGRVISKELSWDESIVGFSGPGSQMEYSARLEETWKDPVRTAQGSEGTTTK